MVSILMRLAILLEKAPAAEKSGGKGGGFDPSILILFVMLFGIMYLLVIRPQKKKERRHIDMLSKLKKNDKVLTLGGVYGIITNINKEKGSIQLKIDDNKDVRIKISMNAIASVISEEKEQSQ